jgi:hypothetical protein
MTEAAQQHRPAGGGQAKAGMGEVHPSMDFLTSRGAEERVKCAHRWQMWANRRSVDGLCRPRSGQASGG